MRVAPKKLSKMAFEDIIEKYRPDLGPLETIYKDLHRNPELSNREIDTACVVAEYLLNLHFTTHHDIGVTGVVGVLENGPGKTVLLRAELDALPVKEETNLPYASRVRMHDIISGDEEEKPVMHACGHDMNMVSLLAAAALLSSAQSHWRGTLICLFQPNEENAGGAKAMVNGGLYDKISHKPDILLAQHVSPHKTGDVILLKGPILTAASSLNVRVFGRGGHGSEPHNCIDPVVIAGYIIVRLQAIVSRETNPQEAGIVTIGSIHGGNVANVIPDHVDFKINIRAFDRSLQERLVDRVKTIISTECKAAQSPQEPTIETVNQFPPTINNDELVDLLSSSFQPYFNDHLLRDVPRPTGSEDFSILADAADGAPYAYWQFGGTEAKKYEDARKQGKLSELPSNHSSKYAPAIEPTLRTGTDAMALAALTVFNSER